MKTIKEIYRIGYGPSSSHTMAPRRAAELFAARHPNNMNWEVTLYGSLGATGKGHLTDWAILQVNPQAQIVWKGDEFLPFHPNALRFRCLDANIYSSFTDGVHRVSFDKVVKVMNQTGHDLPSLYKETAQGGLATNF